MNHYYGELPVLLGEHIVKCDEMLFYQYLPIKLASMQTPILEKRLMPFYEMIGVCLCDFVAKDGLNRYMESYVYLTAKHLFQAPGCSFNRPGYHSDGFMTDDINYIWCDRDPTVFNKSQYALTMHHEYSLSEMDQQSLKKNEVRYKPNELLRLNQFNIHKVADVEKPSMRTFFKLSFSKEKYNLIGNSHNYDIDYEWEMKAREEIRNHPIK